MVQRGRLRGQTATDALTALELIYLCVVLVVSYAIRDSAGFGVVTIPLLASGVPLLFK